MRRVAILAALLVALPVARAQNQPETLDALRKQYEQLQPEEREHWDFVNKVVKEERDLIALIGRAKEAEEEAARSPADAELRAHADALSAEAKRYTEARQQRMGAYQAMYDTHMKKLRSLFQQIEQLYRKDPNDEKVAAFRVKFLADQGAIGEVRDEAEKLYKAHPDDRDVRFSYGESLLVVPVNPQRPGPGVAPQFDKALEVFEPLAKAEPKNDEVQLLYGVAASAMDKNEAAKAAFDSIASIGSVRPAARILIGNAQDPDAAFAVWRDSAAALAADAKNVDARRKRAEFLLAVDAPARAIADGELAAKEKPDDKELKKLLARAYSRAKRWSDAAPLYEALSSDMEKDDELRAEHAIFLFNSDKAADALGELAKIKDSSKFPQKLTELLRSMIWELKKKLPDDFRLEVFLFKNAADQGAWGAIWDEIDKVWEKHQDDPVLRFTYAETLMCCPVPEQQDPRRPPVEPRAPRFAKAYELLTPLVKAEPENKEYLLLHGVAACAIGKDAEAKKELDAVATVESMRPAVRNLIGSAHDPHGMFKKWHEVASGLAEHPDDAELHKKKADLLVSVDAGPLAIKDGEIAVKAKPDDQKARATLARACMAANHFEKALDAFGDPEKIPEEAKGEWVACLFNANKIPEFKAAWDKAKDKRPILRHLGATGQLFQMMPEKLDEIVAKWADEEKARAEDAKKNDNPQIVFETEKGPVKIELFEDTAPGTVANFVWLTENGFFDGVKFHRIIAGFMAQGGDPTGTGTGGPGYNIKDELKGNPRLHWRGTISMANTGRPDTGNSQFFLCYVPTPHLNPREERGRFAGHAVFGRIIEGQEIVDVLERGDAIVKGKVLRKRGHEYKPEMLPAPGQTPWKPAEKK